MAREKIVLKPEVYSEIILGCKMPHKAKLEILKIAEQKFPNTKVYELALHKNKFELVMGQIK
jgi:hypothetical protein